MEDKIFKILSLNVNHMSNLGGLIDIIRLHQPHLVALQEVVQTTEELSFLVSRLNYNAYCSQSETGSSGLAFVYSTTLTVIDILPLEPGRLLQINLSDSFCVINVYGHSGSQGRAERRRLYGETLLRNLGHRASLPLLVGDFNCVLDRKDTLENFKNKHCPALSDLVRVFGYQDGFRVMNPITIDFTYSNPGHFPSRLDRVYFPPNWLELARSVCHFPTLSDHKAVIINLFWKAPQRLPVRKSPYWKLNTRILSDADFLPNFERLWRTLAAKIGTYSGPAAWWEEHAKPGITDFLKRFSKMKAEARKSTRDFLYHSLDIALSEQNWNEIRYIRSRISDMTTEDLFGYTLRSREKAYAEEERGSLYHVAREARRGKDSCLSSLQLPDGTTERDQTAVEEAVVNFFQALFGGQHRSPRDRAAGEPVVTGEDFVPDETHLGEFLEGVGCLDPSLAATLDVDLSLDELNTALDTCSNQRSPGLDGLPYEFYTRVRHVIGPVLLSVFQEQLDSECLIKSNREGVTRLLNKVSPQVPRVDQLRPITLLSCDYKILSKIITARLNNVMTSVTKSGQLCGVAPKNILFGATSLLSSISYVEEFNIPAYIISFDIFKAYDKTSVNFIIKVMRKMKFGERFISFVKTLHKDVSTCFILETLSRRVPVKISVRQGDPAAMPLFLLNIEPLLPCCYGKR